MCDFVSWIRLNPTGRAAAEVTQKILYLDDDMAKVFINANKSRCLEDACGHEAILAYFNLPFQRSRRDSAHHESFEKVPMEIAKKVNQGKFDQLFMASEIGVAMRNIFPRYLARYDRYGKVILPEDFSKEIEKRINAFAKEYFKYCEWYVKNNPSEPDSNALFSVSTRYYNGPGNFRNRKCLSKKREFYSSCAYILKHVKPKTYTGKLYWEYPKGDEK